MDKRLILHKLERLLDLCEVTEPIEDMLPDDQLFTDDLIKVKDWYDTIKEYPKWKEEIVLVNVMREANNIWKFRNKIKENGWEDYSGVEEDIKRLILDGSKIAAIKLHRKHQKECCNNIVSLRDAKDYIDSLANIIKKT
tara:strand:+ start:2190 stop:2606 length:417 start_codon:yes stop_codon:yes gene_type:complete